MKNKTKNQAQEQHHSLILIALLVAGLIVTAWGIVYSINQQQQLATANASLQSRLDSVPTQLK